MLANADSDEIKYMSLLSADNYCEGLYAFSEAVLYGKKY